MVRKLLQRWSKIQSSVSSERHSQPVWGGRANPDFLAHFSYDWWWKWKLKWNLIQNYKIKLNKTKMKQKMKTKPVMTGLAPTMRSAYGLLVKLAGSVRRAEQWRFVCLGCKNFLSGRGLDTPVPVQKLCGAKLWSLSALHPRWEAESISHSSCL